MKNQNSEAEHIRILEERLMRSDIRASRQELSALLADEFIEYGRSGQIFNKEQVIEGLQSEAPAVISILGFEASRLAPEIILATYRAVQSEPDGQRKYSLRSSIWKLIDGRWQLVFHQGTPTKQST